MSGPGVSGPGVSGPGAPGGAVQGAGGPESAHPAPAAAPRFSAGDRVRVRDDWPERRRLPSGAPSCHIRTPHYLRGREGRVERALGAFPNPEDLAFARPAPVRVLYHVLFEQPPLWREGEAGDTVLVEIFEHWLEPAGVPAREAA